MEFEKQGIGIKFDVDGEERQIQLYYSKDRGNALLVFKRGEDEQLVLLSIDAFERLKRLLSYDTLKGEEQNEQD